MRTIHKILSNELPHAESMLAEINRTVNDEAVDFEGNTKRKGSASGGPLAGRNRKIYAVKAERKLL